MKMKRFFAALMTAVMVVSIALPSQVFAAAPTTEPIEAENGQKVNVYAVHVESENVNQLQAVTASGEGTEVTVENNVDIKKSEHYSGNVQEYPSGIVAESGASVSVGGNLTVTDDAIKAQTRGIVAEGTGTIVALGGSVNSVAERGASSGVVVSDGASVTVGGVNTRGYTNSIAAEGSSGSSITVDGDIVAQLIQSQGITGAVDGGDAYSQSANILGLENVINNNINELNNALIASDIHEGLQLPTLTGGQSVLMGTVADKDTQIVVNGDVILTSDTGKPLTVGVSTGTEGSSNVTVNGGVIIESLGGVTGSLPYDIGVLAQGGSVEIGNTVSVTSDNAAPIAIMAQNSSVTVDGDLVAAAGGAVPSGIAMSVSGNTNIKVNGDVITNGDRSYAIQGAGGNNMIVIDGNADGKILLSSGDFASVGSVAVENGKTDMVQVLEDAQLIINSDIDGQFDLKIKTAHEGSAPGEVIVNGAVDSISLNSVAKDEKDTQLYLYELKNYDDLQAVDTNGKLNNLHYLIRVEKSAGGVIQVEANELECMDGSSFLWGNANESVKITVKPDKGYHFNGLNSTVSYSYDPVTGEYTVVIPAGGGVDIGAIFEKIAHHKKNSNDEMKAGNDTSDLVILTKNSVTDMVTSDSGRKIELMVPVDTSEREFAAVVKSVDGAAVNEGIRQIREAEKLEGTESAVAEIIRAIDSGDLSKLPVSIAGKVFAKSMRIEADASKAVTVYASKTDKGFSVLFFNTATNEWEEISAAVDEATGLVTFKAPGSGFAVLIANVTK